MKTVFPNGKERSSKAIPESETAPATQRTGQSNTFGRGSFAPVTVSVVGGILHNVGQILTACFVMETAEIAYYLPVLFISGTIAGIVIGYVAGLILKRLEKMK